jgi:hypothetical protein
MHRRIVYYANDDCTTYAIRARNLGGSSIVHEKKSKCGCVFTQKGNLQRPKIQQHRKIKKKTMDEQEKTSAYNLCQDIMKRYNTTSATAAECLEALTQGLLDMDEEVTDDCVETTWQELTRLAKAEVQEADAAEAAVTAAKEEVVNPTP